VTDKDVITKPSLVYFGYTFCPDVCPLDNARNVEVVDILEEMGHEVTPVFISIDPERDTPEQLADFAEIMHPRMIALTGTPEQVARPRRPTRPTTRCRTRRTEFYLVDHSTFTYLHAAGKRVRRLLSSANSARGDGRKRRWPAFWKRPERPGTI
jgi:protein SCO1